MLQVISLLKASESKVTPSDSDKVPFEIISDSTELPSESFLFFLRINIKYFRRPQ